MRLTFARRDPYWGLDGRSVRRARARRRTVAAGVVILCAIILALTLARLPVVDAGSLVSGPSRAILFLSLALDVLACGLVLTVGLRRPSLQRFAWEDDGGSGPDLFGR
ncbi:MAG: hypothetical protein ABIQ58_06565 [Candidatus Limnocylindrales bacterium]